MTDVSFPLRITLADQIRWHEYRLDQPAIRRKRIVLWVATAVLAPCLGIALAEILTWIKHPPTSFQVGLAAAGDRVFQWDTLDLLWAPTGLMLAGWGLLRLTRRARLRRALRKELLGRPGIDPADPDLADTGRISAGPDGIVFESRSTVSKVDWTAITRLVETPDLLILHTAPNSAMIVPMRDLRPADLALFRQLYAEGWALKPSP